MSMLEIQHFLTRDLYLDLDLSDDFVPCVRYYI